MRYLLDTNICVHLIQRHPPHLLRRFQEFNYGDLAISVVTLAELRHGVERDASIKHEAERALDELLTYISLCCHSIMPSQCNMALLPPPCATAAATHSTV